MDYNLLLEQYKKILLILQSDSRDVSKEMIQVIHDDIEDIMIIQGKASQIQPSINGCIGYEINNY